MKVQSKGSLSMKFEVVEESPSFYIIQDMLGKAVVSKADYEPVQEWVNVTKDCALLEDGYGRYSLFHNGCAVEVANTRYKVTKNGAVIYRVEVKR